MYKTDFNPWKNYDEYDPEELSQKQFDLEQWPIKLWKAPVLSPYYHHAHLLIAADCTAYAYEGFQKKFMHGRVILICCMETDFDCLMKLQEIFSHNTIKSVTVVKTDKSCCSDLINIVMQAAKYSRFPIPVHTATLIIQAEDMEEDDL